jgi:hypothetical protein
MARLHRGVKTDSISSDFRPSSLRDVVAQFAGMPNTPNTRDMLQRVVEDWLTRLHDGREFLVVGEGDSLSVNVMPDLPMSAATFTELTGHEPVRDDLDRVNCPTTGVVGHMMCGWCLVHYGPRFQCGCVPGVR